MHQSVNVIGVMLVKLRFTRGWTQTALAIKLQLLGCYMTRQLVAHIEAGRCAATDTHVVYLAKAFRVCVLDLFPEVLRHDPSLELLAKHCHSRQPRDSRPAKKSRRSK